MGENKQHVLTKDGLEKRRDELEHLKIVRRKEIAEKIKIAMSFGDLSENSEYDEAKNEQAKVEARIADLEAMLKNVKVIDEKELNTKKIHVGSKVKLKDLELNETCEYRIVGSSEANPLDGLISDESPVGMALLGHKTKDTVEVQTPGGTIQYSIMKITK